MSERERLAADFKQKAAYCHTAWSALQLAQIGTPSRSESITELWTRFQQARVSLERAYNALNAAAPRTQLGPIELYYV